MATLVLSAAGAALGGSVGGAFAGVSSLAIGRAAGAAFGSILDRSFSGGNSRTIERGKVDRLRVMGSSEGATLPRVFGRIRLAGQIIWSSRFLESTNSTNVGGKGSSQRVTDYSYSVSLALALCEGEIIRVGRIWADGLALDQSTLTFRLHTGSEFQVPDPLIAAIEGNSFTPAYRGTAYIVFDNLDLRPFGNRIPQFNFEVFRRVEKSSDGKPLPSSLIQGVALIPGTGEYSLSTTPVNLKGDAGRSEIINVHNDQGVPDLIASLDQLEAELPNVKSVSLVVTWFGDDLRCNHCNLQPAVEQGDRDGDQIHWVVNGISRSKAKVVSKLGGKPAFGGTPCDSAVIQAIRYLHATGKQILFYPFVLMDIMASNQLSDPWSDSPMQPAVPWRGRITLSVAPGQHNSPDRTSEATEQVLKFFGNAQPSDFIIHENTVEYHGPNEWSFRRFVLHNAFLCKACGGVDAFCIGSELPGLTRIRGENETYPTVKALKDLAFSVRLVVGNDTKIGYAADWSEYFGHHPDDKSGDVIFHLDPLWADPKIDFIGIDNYMPIADWRDGPDHLDIGYSSIYNDQYLSDNISGGEGFDWYYRSDDERARQIRTKISDEAYNEDWIFRYKDLKNWWGNYHFNRSFGKRSECSTEWIPKSKPIWFTELGCPAVNKGANQPNVFQDRVSSESSLPYFSNGGSDEYIQYCYLRSHLRHWSHVGNNPESDIYVGRMLDLARIHVWAWDCRPWPDFPSRIETWVDGKNYLLGHWINGRATLIALSDLVYEIASVGSEVEFNISLNSSVSGYTIEYIESIRESISKLSLIFGFDMAESSGLISFAERRAKLVHVLDISDFVISSSEANLIFSRKGSGDNVKFVSVSYIRPDLEYQIGVLEASCANEKYGSVLNISFPAVLSDNEAQLSADRLLSEEIISRDTVSFFVGISKQIFEPGDFVQIKDKNEFKVFLINRIEISDMIRIDACKLQIDLYDYYYCNKVIDIKKEIIPQNVTNVVICDLPRLPGENDLIGPHVAVSRLPWRGAISIYSHEKVGSLSLISTLYNGAIFGELLDFVVPGYAGIWMNFSVKVKIFSGFLEGIEKTNVLEWGNIAAVRCETGAEWEIVQFCEAKLTEMPGIYELNCLLRGQLGTDHLSFGIIPQGSEFILLGSGIVKLGLEVSCIGMERDIFVGPSVKPYTDASYLEIPVSISKISLRPYKPAHLKFMKLQNGDFHFSWISRDLLDLDRWDVSNDFLDIGENSFFVRIIFNNEVVFSNMCYDKNFIFNIDQNEFGDNMGIFEVSQVSSVVGLGIFARILFY